VSGRFQDDFDGPALDTDVWLPHYLPHWSSRAESRASFSVGGSELRLTIPADQGLWCEGDHDPPLRVSGIQSGVLSGQQPFRPGQVVREEQPAWWGWTPFRGLVEIRARMDLSPRSMASVWMVGLEDEPHRCGEICVFEVFGDAIDAGGAAVGMGIHPFRDPALIDDFEALRLALDVREPHVYAADWQPGRVEFYVDGEHVRSVDQAPDYPMQFMVAVFDFPARGGPSHVPLFAVDWIRGSSAAEPLRDRAIRM
jgi:hypothetical protein